MPPRNESDNDTHSSEDRSARKSRPRRRGLDRFGDALRNGLEIARKGGIGERKPAPFDVPSTGPNHRLRHYFPNAAGAFPNAAGAFPGAAGAAPDAETIASKSQGTPVILVPPLMMSADLWDVSAEASVVRTLNEAGIDPWVVDFGSPEDEEGGLERDLTDHVLAVSAAVDAVREATGQDIHLMGYSQGGMFAYQAAAYRQAEGIRSLVTFGSGVDLHGGLPSTLPPELVISSIEKFGELQATLIPEGIPSWATRLGFQLMDPVKTLQQRIDFLRRLSDREALEKRDGMRRFMEDEGWTAFPGPALADLLRQLVAQNRLLQGGLVIGGRTVTLADIDCPILAFVGKADTIAPPDTVRAIHAAAPNSDAYQVSIDTGHFGLVVGSTSSEFTWPAVIDWLAWRDDDGALPKAARRLVAQPTKTEPRTPLDDIRDATALAVDLGSSLLGGAAVGLGRRIGVLGRLAQSVAPQIPQLSRLADIRSGTRVSPGLSLLERAQVTPDDTFFLFEGRAHSYHDANVRIDYVVRGLIEVGVHQGHYVGVLMQTRPSAVAATVALSRLGAIPVLLRPDLPIDEQLSLLRLDHLVADPEHAERAAEDFDSPVCVLGGGGEERTLQPGLIDMEAIDPDAVEVPDWYEADPGRAGELALVLIAGDTGHLRASRVTNRRWATSAFGTASACALTSQDTVYCCSPIHHPTGILVCIGGALSSGARLAMANEFGPGIEPERFWRDVRRYGVSVVFYSGAMCAAILGESDSQADQHNQNVGIRLFAGSGMPKGVWRRVAERFSPATIVEFFASTEGNAVLVNLTGKKMGSLGRPMPGAAEVAVAAWDLEAGKLIDRKSGFAAHCTPGDIGLLLERVNPERGELDSRPLRGVFEPGDAWLDTRDLVRVDKDGDYWLVDYASDVVRTADGSVATLAVENALTAELPEIDLAAVYGVRRDGHSHDTLVAALTLRPGTKIDPIALRRVVDRRLPAPQRPRVVRIIDALPMTAGYRTRKRTLRQAALGLKEGAGEALYLAPNENGYITLEKESQLG